MEYLIGDGPQNRFALICSECQSHNGMALREEFEYIGNICSLLDTGFITCVHAVSRCFWRRLSAQNLENY